MESYFIWNDVDSRGMGVYLRGPVERIKPEERVQHVTIPGRPGELTLLEGDGIYNSYIQSVSVRVKGGFRINEVLNWLKGDGYVTFGNEPDRRQKARVIGAVTLNKLSRNLDIWVGEVQFYCSPLKEKLEAETVTITPSANGVLIEGDVPARIKMTVSCTGDGSGGQMDTTITVAGQSFTVRDNWVTTVFIVDSDAAIVTDAPGTTNWTLWSSGDFPLLPPGLNTFTGSGWSQIVLEKRERFL